MISIVVPFYNSERFFEETILSVLAQYYNNWELLLVNDGSADSSGDIAKYYSEQDSRIREISYGDSKNRGKSHARNLGIDQSSGKYICFLDSDDVYKKDNLSTKISIFQEHSDIDLVLGNTVYWNSWDEGKLEESDVYTSHGLKPNTSYKKHELIPLLTGLRGAMPCICSFLVKKDVVLSVNGFNDGFSNLYEDQALIVKVCCASNSYVLGEYGEFYRQRADSDWHLSLKNGEDRKVFRQYKKWLYEYLIALDIQDQCIVSELNRIKPDNLMFDFLKSTKSRLLRRLSLQ